jgi:tetratricopeptide (TPR) repeat protein
MRAALLLWALVWCACVADASAQPQPDERRDAAVRLLGHAGTLLMNGRLEEAHAVFVEAADATQAWPDLQRHALTWSGVTARRLGRMLKESMEWLKKADAVGSPSSETKYHLAVSHVMSGAFADGLINVVESLQLTPMSQAYELLSTILSALEQWEALEEVLAVCLQRSDLALDASRWMLTAERGIALDKLGRAREANELLEEAARLGGGRGAVHERVSSYLTAAASNRKAAVATPFSQRQLRVLLGPLLPAAAPHGPRDLEEGAVSSVSNADGSVESQQKRGPLQVLLDGAVEANSAGQFEQALAKTETALQLLSSSNVSHVDQSKASWLFVLTKLLMDHFKKSWLCSFATSTLCAP